MVPLQGRDLMTPWRKGHFTDRETEAQRLPRKGDIGPDVSAFELWFCQQLAEWPWTVGFTLPAPQLHCL